jgi:hypothetical protein
LDDLAVALSRAVAAGTKAETDVRMAAWVSIVVLADRFATGFA